MTSGRPRPRDRGFVLVLFALVVVLMLIFTAFAVDLGLLYNERRSDQNAADASATSAGVVLVQSGSLQASVDEVVAAIDTNLGRTLDAAEWVDCNDTAPFDDTAAELSLTPATECISFSNSRARIRVRVPDQGIDSAFGGVIGIEEYTSTAFAEINLELPGGGALPFVTLDTAAPGDQICLRTDGTGSLDNEPPDQLGFDPYTVRGPDPCSRVNFLTHDGGRGTIKPYFYDGCVRPTGNQSIVSAIMVGMDHLPGIWDPAVDLDPGDSAGAWDSAAGARIDGNNDCSVLNPNTIDVDTGLTSGLLACALLDSPCNGGGDATTGEDGRLREAGSGASFIGRPVNDTPLWDYFVDDIPDAAPDSCDVAADDSSDFYLRRAALQACLADAVWLTGSITLFTEDVAESPRFGYVPHIAEMGMCNIQPDPDSPTAACSGAPLDNVHINAFSPVFIDGLYQRQSGGSPPMCDPDNLSTVFGETDWSIHYPGKGLDCATDHNIDRLSAYVLACGALPKEICDPGLNPPFAPPEGIVRVRLTR